MFSFTWRPGYIAMLSAVWQSLQTLKNNMERTCYGSLPCCLRNNSHCWLSWLFLGFSCLSTAFRSRTSGSPRRDQPSHRTVAHVSLLQFELNPSLGSWCHQQHEILYLSTALLALFGELGSPRAESQWTLEGGWWLCFA